MIQGHATVRWKLVTREKGPEGEQTEVFDSEPVAREAFSEAVRSRFVSTAKLFMVTELETASHFKSERR